MKPKDTIEYYSGVDTQKYKGIVTWIDEEKKECGVVILEPQVAQGGAEVLKLEETKIVVLDEFKPTTFRRDLSELTVEELQSEIEEMRSGRITTKQVRHKQKRVDPQEALLLKTIANLPPELADKLRKGLKKADEQIAG